MILFKKPPEHVVVHHSATKPSLDLGVEELREVHKSKRWADVGYHWVIKRDGQVEQGRDRKYQGAHCKAKGMNAKSYGICLIGGLNEISGEPENNYTFRQLNSLYSLLGILNLEVSGHHDHDPYMKKYCPMFNVKEFYEVN
jgi:N-acetyl-anhydromuramyl-L-alanine amidase AmpD